MLRRRLNPLLHGIALHAHGDSHSRPREFTFRLGALWPRLPIELRHRLTPRPTYATDRDVPPARLDTIRAHMGANLLPAYRPLQAEQILAVAVAIAFLGRPHTVETLAERLGCARSEAAAIPLIWEQLAEHRSWTDFRSAAISRVDELSREGGQLAAKPDPKAATRERLAPHLADGARYPRSRRRIVTDVCASPCTTVIAALSSVALRATMLR